MPDSLDELLVRQSEVISRRQLVDCGLSTRAWDCRLSSRRWQRLLPGIAVAHSGGVSEIQQWWAACLYGGKGAALGGRAALTLFGAKLSSADHVNGIDVVIPLTRQVRDAELPDGTPVVARRLKQPERWTTYWHGLPVVNAHASVLHAAAWAKSAAQAEFLVTAPLQQRKSSVPQLRRMLKEMPELTRRALIREVLDDVELGATAVSERRFLEMCRRWGVPLPDEMQLRLRAGTRTHYLDVRYERQRITIEVDGAHHRDAAQWDADALRTLRVIAALPGEQVIRITTGMLRNHEAEVAALLLSILVGSAAA